VLDIRYGPQMDGALFAILLVSCRAVESSLIEPLWLDLRRARSAPFFIACRLITDRRRTVVQAHRGDRRSSAPSRDEVWGDYRFAVLADSQESDGLKVIVLGAGHSSSGETLCGRVIGALKSEALLNESVGAGYIERNWPPALKDAGAWPLASLRQSFLNGSLTRLVDPDTTLKFKIVEFVTRGDFGLASGKKADGTYERMWFQEMVPLDEVASDAERPPRGGPSEIRSDVLIRLRVQRR
jgi:hypothetical protein